MVKAREAQTEWLAYLCMQEAGQLPVMVLGKAYKRGTDLTGGSPAILLKKILDEYGVLAEQWDPHVDGPLLSGKQPLVWRPSVFVVATHHDEFYEMEYPVGSIIIDPWGKMRDRAGVKVIRVGRR